jgi:hypothetical protein
VYNVSFGPDAPSQVLNLTARQLYNTQDNLAAVVNFLANSVAQLPIKVYKRGDGDDRQHQANDVPTGASSDGREYRLIGTLLGTCLARGTLCPTALVRR